MPSPRLRAVLAATLILAAVVAAIALLDGCGHSSRRSQAAPAAATRVRVGLRMPSLNGHRPQLASSPQIFVRKPHRILASAASPITGETLSTTTGTWTGNPVPPYGYQWEDCNSSGTLSSCVDIAGAVASTYTLVSSDIGHTIRVSVTASNAFGFASQSSAATGVVASAGGTAPANTATPAVTGTPTQGQVLTVTKGTWTNSPTSYTYQWQDCDAEVVCADIPGASGTFSGATATFTLTAAQVNHTVRATITATNGTGSGSAFSNASAGVAASGGSGGTWSGTQETGAASTICDKYLATAGSTPAGSDSNAGTSAAPWLTIDHMVATLTSGQTGCLKAGTYGSTTDFWNIATANVTITAAPGAAATVQGRPAITASGVTVSYLNLDIDYLESYSSAIACTGQTQGPFSFDVEASNATVVHNNMFQTDLTGSQRGGIMAVAQGALGTMPAAGYSGINISFNRMHDYGCSVGGGQEKQHGMYISNANNSTFNDNWIYNGSFSAQGGACFQFYEGATGFNGDHDDQTLGNVCDHTGLGAFIYGETSFFRNMVMSHNLITTTTALGGFSANGGLDSSDTFTNNDGQNILTTWPCGGDCGAATVSGNITVDPQYTTANTGSNTPDFRAANPAVSTWGLWNGDNGTATAVIGTATVGASQVWQDANFKRANCAVAGASGTVTRITAFLSPTGVAGTQKIKGAVYANSSGPSTLIAQSSDLNFASTNSAGWYDFLLTTPLSVTSGTTYCLALLTGTTTQVAAVSVASGGTLYYDSNTYPDLSNPFGSWSTAAQTMSTFMIAQ